MKISEKQHTMLAKTQYRVLSATLRVCDVRLPNFALVILPGKLIFWAVCNRNQTIILSWPN